MHRLIILHLSKPVTGQNYDILGAPFYKTYISIDLLQNNDTVLLYACLAWENSIATLQQSKKTLKALDRLYVVNSTLIISSVAVAVAVAVAVLA